MSKKISLLINDATSRYFGVHGDKLFVLSHSRWRIERNRYMIYTYTQGGLNSPVKKVLN